MTTTTKPRTKVTDNLTQDQWRDANPLRVWRSKVAPALLRADVAASTSLGLSTIANIEAGATALSPRNRDALAKLMGLKPEALDAAWKKWMDSNPLLHREAKGAPPKVAKKSK